MPPLKGDNGMSPTLGVGKYGVWGESDDGTGVVETCSGGIGVEGASEHGNGVMGVSQNVHGVLSCLSPGVIHGSESETASEPRAYRSTSVTSTRRLAWRQAPVPLSATGAVSPRPLSLMWPTRLGVLGLEQVPDRARPTLGEVEVVVRRSARGCCRCGRRPRRRAPG